MTTTISQSASAKLRRREQMYRDYMEFFELAERNRRWNPMEDISWELLDTPAMRQQIADSSAEQKNTGGCLETFCGVELFIPDYTKNGLNISRDIFGQAWFHLAWGYEESKHALVFREYLLRSGLRTLEQYMDYEEEVLRTEWKMPYLSIREMACYGALQEIATYLIYAKQHDYYKNSGNQVLTQIFKLIARDEAAHASFYRKLMRFEFAEDPEGTAEDLAYVITHFEMPGEALIPNFHKRLQTDGVAISKQIFLERGVMPTLKVIGMSRRDFLAAKHRRENREKPTDVSAQKSPCTDTH